MNTKKKKSTFKKQSKKLKGGEKLINKFINKVKDPLKTCYILNLLIQNNKFELSDLKKLIGTSKSISNNTHPLFRSDKNTNYINNYLRKFIIKYGKKNRKNLNNTIVIIKCMGSTIGQLYALFNKIFNYDYDEESEDFKEYVSNEYKQHPKGNIYDLNTTEQLDKFKTDLSSVAIPLIIDFVTETLILSSAHYEVHIRKSKGKQSVIKNGVEAFLKELDVSEEYNIKQVVTHGKTYSKYISLVDILLGDPKDILEIDKQTLNKQKLEEMKINAIQEIKSQLKNVFAMPDIKKKIQNMSTENLLKENEEKDKLRDLAFDENQSSSFLFIIIGLLGVALLTKFNVFAPSTNIGTGFA